MSLLSPIQVVAVQYEPEKDGKMGFTIGLSHQVKNFHLLDISLVNREGNPVVFESYSKVPCRKSLSNSWLIFFDENTYASEDRNSFTLSISQKNSPDTTDFAETADGHKLFRRFLIHIDVHCNLETDMLHATYELAERQVYPQANELLTTLNGFLATELTNLRELTSFEAGLEFAQLRQLELLRAQFEYFANPFYNDLDEQLEAPFAFQVETEIHDLAARLERECE